MTLRVFTSDSGFSLPPLPRPPEPTVQRFTADGRPTSAQVEYENRLYAFLKAIADAQGSS